jgi:hypothetical protein
MLELYKGSNSVGINQTFTEISIKEGDEIQVRLKANTSWQQVYARIFVKRETCGCQSDHCMTDYTLKQIQLAEKSVENSTLQKGDQFYNNQLK